MYYEKILISLKPCLYTEKYVKDKYEGIKCFSDEKISAIFLTSNSEPKGSLIKTL